MIKNRLTSLFAIIAVLALFAAPAFAAAPDVDRNTEAGNVWTAMVDWVIQLVVVPDGQDDGGEDPEGPTRVAPLVIPDRT